MAFFDAQAAALAGRTLRCDFLVELRFASSTAYVHNGNRPLTSGGHVWQPMYGTGNIEGLAFSGSATMSSVALTLNGLPTQEPDLLSAALDDTEEVFQRLALLHLQTFDEHFAPLGAPAPFWFGFMQPPEISQTPATDDTGIVQSIRIEVVNPYFNRSLPPNGRLNDRDQQSKHPGDKVLQFMPGLLFATFTYPDY